MRVRVKEGLMPRLWGDTLSHTESQGDQKKNMIFFFPSVRVQKSSELPNKVAYFTQSADAC